MLKVNLLAAWVGVLLGLLSGIPLGLFFHKENWLGGYASWPRRLLRLGHVSFFGIAFLNFAFVFTAQTAPLKVSELFWPPALLVVAQFSMPLVCLLSAIRKPLRQLFFVPVLSAVGGTVSIVALLFGVLK